MSLKCYSLKEYKIAHEAPKYYLIHKKSSNGAGLFKIDKEQIKQST